MRGIYESNGQMNPRPTMFIGSSVEGLDVANAVQENLWRDILITKWDQGVFKPTKNTLEDLAEAVSKYDFAAFILSRDDASVIRKQELSVVRDNVVLEAGMFIGKLGRERVFLVVPYDEEKLHLPTDLLGTTTLEYDALRPDNNLQAATAPACNSIRAAAKRLGSIRASEGVVAYGDAVVVTTFDGSYIQASSDEQGTLTATSRQLDQWDLFRVASATGSMIGRSVKFGDSIGLRVLKNDQYVGANLNGEGRELTACASKLDTYETFVVTPIQAMHSGKDVLYGSSFALKAANDNYVAYRPEDTRAFWAAASTIQGWERLMFVEPERQ